MLSVSGWSRPSAVSFSLSVSSSNTMASARAAGPLVGERQIVARPERVGMFAPELGLFQLERLLVERDRVSDTSDGQNTHWPDRCGSGACRDGLGRARFVAGAAFPHRARSTR